MKLLTVGGNTKIAKGDAQGEYLTAILHLAPAKLSGREVCPGRSEGCTKACLNTAGRGRFDNVQAARIRKTQWLFRDREGFLRQLRCDIHAHVRKCERLGVLPAVRLNGTSDLPWENIHLDGATLMDWFPEVQFYDYTKVATRIESMLAYRKLWPRNYHLTFSVSDRPGSEEQGEFYAFKGATSAVVFRDTLPVTWKGLPVINGDETDLRFKDPRGVIVGLLAKGKAKQDTSGFVKEGACA
jgi:hypothetical protein